MEEEPPTVKGLLSEMKDTSELAVYLSYSALMFRDRQIAEEVAELEESVDELNSKMIAASMLAVRNQEDAEKVGPLLRISSSIDEISNAASEIAELLQRGIEIHPVIFEALEMAEEKVARCKILGESELVGTSLGAADLESNVGMAVIAMRLPDGRWIWGPDDETVIPRESVLIARGPRDGASILRQIARGERSLVNLGGEER
jgi:uncharacterized protein with PhoU and TrkA domain